jgi:hypothetical protein
MDDNEIQKDMFYCLQCDEPTTARMLYFATAFVAVCAVVCLFL